MLLCTVPYAQYTVEVQSCLLLENNSKVSLFFLLRIYDDLLIDVCLFVCLFFDTEVPCNDNPCTSLPCQNGGSCLTMDASYYICICPEDFLGINCQTRRCK